MTKKAAKEEPAEAKTPTLVERIKALPKSLREKEVKAELKYRGKDKTFREAFLEARGVSVTPQPAVKPGE